MHRAIRYRAADSYFGLILSSYSDRPNKSVQRIFIHFSLPLARGLRHSRQSQQGGAHVPFTVAPDLATQHNTHTAGQQPFRLSTRLSSLSKPILTVIILTDLYYFVYGGEGSIASRSMAKKYLNLKSLKIFRKLKTAYTCVSHRRNVLSQRTVPFPLTDCGRT